MKIRTFKQHLKHKRKQGYRTAPDMILEIWDDEDQVPPWLNELMMHNPPPQPIVLLMGPEMSDAMDKALEEYFNAHKIIIE